jgi:tetratricopeptide (TPR) repeat protein
VQADTLFDRKYTAGLDASLGFHFEDRYVLANLPRWIAGNEVRGLQQELSTDVEVFLDSGKRWFIQIKDQTLTKAMLRKILGDFACRVGLAGKHYEKYIVASRSLSGSLRTLARHLKRYRSAAGLTKAERKDSRSRLEAELETVGAGDLSRVFAEELFLETDLAWLDNESQLAGHFCGALVRQFGVTPEYADRAFEKTARDLVATRGSYFSVREIRDRLKFESERSRLDDFDLVTEEFLERARSNPQQSFFYSGARPTWADVMQDRDIRRDIGDTLLARLGDSLSGKVLVPILAEGGEGKSTFLRRLAGDLARKGNLVLYHRSDRQSARMAEIRRLAESSNVRLYVFLDDAPRLDNLGGFVSSLAELPIPVVVVAASRPYEWQPVKSLCAANLEVVLAPDGREWTLGALSDHEIELVFQKLADNEMINPIDQQTLPFAIAHYAGTSKRRLLVVVLELAQGKKVAEIIRGEVERVSRIGDTLLRAYRYICLTGSVHSFITIDMLKELLAYEDIGLDVAVRLRGLVEVIGGRAYARHDKIAEMATDIFFEEADDERGETLCRLISLSFARDEVDALRSMAQHLHVSVPKSQVFRVIGHLVDEGCSAGDGDLVAEVMDDFRTDFDSQAVFEDLLASKTRIILEAFLLEASQVKRVDWSQLRKLRSGGFSSLGSGRRPRFVQCSLALGLRFAKIYGWAVWQAASDSPTRQLFRRVTHTIYESLIAEYPEQAARINLPRAEFLRETDCCQDAIQFYEMVLQKEPNSAEAHIGLAVCLYSEDRYDKALRHYRAARRLDRGSVRRNGHEDSARVMLEGMGEWDDLLDLMRDTIARNADAMRGWWDSDYGRAMLLDLRLKKHPDETEKRLLRHHSEADEEQQKARFYIAFVDHLAARGAGMSPIERDNFARKVFGAGFGELRGRGRA